MGAKDLWRARHFLWVFSRMQITFKQPCLSRHSYIGRVSWWVEIMMTAAPARLHGDLAYLDELDNLAASLDHLTRCFCEPDVAGEDVDDAAIAA
jgi:hypothetical protein